MPRGILRARREKKSRERVSEKNIARSDTLSAKLAVYESDATRSDPADNFFPSVKSLSSPPRFPEEGTALGRRKTRYEVSESFTLSDVFVARVIPRSPARALSPLRAETESLRRRTGRRYNFNHLSVKQRPQLSLVKHT